MNRADLLLRLRRDYLDDTVERYLWTTEALGDFLGDAQRQVCLRKRALIDSRTPGVATLAIAANARGVRLDPAVLAVRSCRIAGACEPLRGITAKRLWKSEPAWDTSDAGTPSFWVPDYQEGWLYFDRPVAVASTLNLSVWRMPLADEMLEEDDDEPVIAEHWHQDLLDWAAYRAFNVKDSELYDEVRADRALRTFEAKVGRLPSMTEVRLWGISPIVGVPAEFD